MCCARSAPKTPNIKANKFSFFLTKVAAKTMVSCFVFRRVRVQISAPKTGYPKCPFSQLLSGLPGRYRHTALPVLAARRPPFTILPNHYLPVTLIFDAIETKPKIFLRRNNSPQWAKASSLSRIHDHTQRHTTVGSTPLDE